MKRYAYGFLSGLLVLLVLGLLGAECQKSMERANNMVKWPPDTIRAVKMSETYTVTAPPDTTPGAMSLQTSYDPSSESATWPPDTIMFIIAPPDTTP